MGIQVSEFTLPRFPRSILAVTSFRMPWLDFSLCISQGWLVTPYGCITTKVVAHPRLVSYISFEKIISFSFHRIFFLFFLGSCLNDSCGFL